MFIILVRKLTCVYSKLGGLIAMYSYTVVFMSANTDHCDAVCLELLSRLLYPRGLGKKAVFIKRFEVCVVCKLILQIGFVNVCVWMYVHICPNHWLS